MGVIDNFIIKWISDNPEFILKNPESGINDYISEQEYME